MSTGAAGGRRSSAPTSSTEAGVRPVEVVEHEHERLRRREQLEQLAHCAVAAVALVLERRPRPSGERRQRGKDVRELRSARRRRGASSRRGSSPCRYSSSASTKTQKGRSRSSSDARAREHELPARVRARGELGEQAGLADARLPDQLDRDRHAPESSSARDVDRATPSSSARPTRCSACRATFLLRLRIDQGRPPDEIRVRDQGAAPMSAGRRGARLDVMSRYLLHHRHEPHECGVVFAAFKGHDSPLRHQPTLASCAPAGTRSGGPSMPQPRRKRSRCCPFYVAERTTATSVSEVEIP